MGLSGSSRALVDSLAPEWTTLRRELDCRDPERAAAFIAAIVR